MHIKKHLSHDALISDYTDRVSKILDRRRKASSDYEIKDVMLTALACMYMQSPSLRSFQESLEKKTNRNNLISMFQVKSTPKTTAMKELIDEIRPEELTALFKIYVAKLQRNNFLKEYQFINDKYLVALDGTEYFSSKKISCSCCLTQEHKNGSITYSHKALQAVIISPNKKQVLPLMPEDISNTDGKYKQDCEINAAKRLIPKIRSAHPRMPKIWLADSLYATDPFIRLLKSNPLDNYILRAKESDHKKLYQTIDEIDPIKHEELINNGKETLYYRWYNNIKLNASSDIDVNVLRVYSTKTDRYGKKESTIIGLWITDLEITDANVSAITKAARSRWMIENECFNTLKNYGYCIDHSYGHGQKNLAFNFYTLILIAFMLHQIQELTEKIFQQARSFCSTRKAFWADLLFMFNKMLFDDWYHMMRTAVIMMDPKYEGFSPPT